MKKSLTAFINNITGENDELLEEIVENKFSKFKKLYWTLKNYSDKIEKIDYKETKKETLKVEIKFTDGSKPRDIAKEIIENIKKKDKKFISIKPNSKTLNIEINKDENEDEVSHD